VSGGYGAVDDGLVAALVRICGEERVATDEKTLPGYGRDRITEEHNVGRRSA
jgi:hypothetical protein